MIPSHLMHPMRSYTHRVYEGSHAGKYLVTVDTQLQPRSTHCLDPDGRSLETLLQCYCVVDDFGNLVPVRGWL